MTDLFHKVLILFALCLALPLFAADTPPGPDAQAVPEKKTESAAPPLQEGAEKEAPPESGTTPESAPASLPQAGEVETEKKAPEEAETASEPAPPSAPQEKSVPAETEPVKEEKAPETPAPEALPPSRPPVKISTDEDEKPGPAVVTTAPDTGMMVIPRTELLAMRREIQALREDIRQLSESMNLLINQVMADLRDENERLLAEVAELREEQAFETSLVSPEPVMPEIPEIPGEVVMDIYPETEESGYRILEEWGRSPEVAQELGGGATSLKGMVCVTQPRQSRETLESIAVNMRKQYSNYDNINIRVYDDEKAGRASLESSAPQPDHLAISISKHKSSGRDVTLVYAEGQSWEVDF